MIWILTYKKLHFSYKHRRSLIQTSKKLHLPYNSKRIFQSHTRYGEDVPLPQIERRAPVRVFPGGACLCTPASFLLSPRQPKVHHGTNVVRMDFLTLLERTTLNSDPEAMALGKQLKTRTQSPDAAGRLPTYSQQRTRQNLEAWPSAVDTRRNRWHSEWNSTPVRTTWRNTKMELFKNVFFFFLQKKNFHQASATDILL